MENMENLWRGRFTIFTTPLGKPALAGEQLSHIYHIADTRLFFRRNGKKGRNYDMYRKKFFKGERGRALSRQPPRCNGGAGLFAAFASYLILIVPVYRAKVLRRLRGE